MIKITAIVMTMLFGLLSASLYAAQKDAAGCKDHPLIPRMTGYYIDGCNDSPAEFDMDIIKGETTETVHIVGKSMALSYSPQPELKAKPGELQLRSDFENAVKKQGGTMISKTPGQQWPVYKIVKDGKEYLVVFMITSGEYYDGSYAYRIIEK
jgi:OOP family OmpA-OmpF porin